MDMKATDKKLKRKEEYCETAPVPQVRSRAGSLTAHLCSDTEEAP
eukprot:CAMPEP_0195002934 /NCGR_PEP_ID=MMETSP0326_2-20130528/3128_1 /TAXON_ID=2866 ORGANISM="Crypthecodinium cohnii, Strain Seligo" /NCGR_SAMPLE_ID=MMETSP0326_2 /ASSEMBLY_ACC=CAM_ASM_000348 /LENGTH=44 /DNA_ID= /DNA_START= /DNA_END= /DNA_ORIENTATION=